jgi:hypothetical protein
MNVSPLSQIGQNCELPEFAMYDAYAANLKLHPRLSIGLAEAAWAQALRAPKLIWNSLNNLDDSVKASALRGLHPIAVIEVVLDWIPYSIRKYTPY